MEIAQLLIASGFTAGFMTILQMLIQRHWSKQDQKHKEEREDQEKKQISPTIFDAIVSINRCQVIEFVHSHGREYINEGEITLEAKETIKEMYSNYKMLGGNGHLDTVMEEIEKLKVIS